MAAALFLDPANYEKLASNTVEVNSFKGEPIAYPIVEVPVGTVVHRADHKGATTPSAEMPAFFGNRQSIAVYARNAGDAAYSSYKVTKPIRLLNWNFNSVRDLMFHHDLQDDEYELLKKYINFDDFYVNPIQILSRDNITGTHVDYLNKKIARIVCRLGFDGWIVKPFAPEKREGLVQWVPSRKARAPYAAEMMICKWSDFMERLPEAIKGGRRSRRRRSRRRRTTRKA